MAREQGSFDALLKPPTATKLDVIPWPINCFYVLVTSFKVNSTALLSVTRLCPHGVPLRLLPLALQAPAPEIRQLRNGHAWQAQQMPLPPNVLTPIPAVSGQALDIECSIDRWGSVHEGNLSL